MRPRPDEATREMTRLKQERTAKYIGMAIKSRRLYLQLTQQQVADRIQELGIDVNRSNYAHYEAGKVEIGMSAFLAIAKVLKTPVGLLLNEDTAIPSEDQSWLTTLRTIQQGLSAKAQTAFAESVTDHARSISRILQQSEPAKD